VSFAKAKAGLKVKTSGFLAEIFKRCLIRQILPKRSYVEKILEIFPDKYFKI